MKVVEALLFHATREVTAKQKSEDSNTDAISVDIEGPNFKPG
jgi:hypothetical protein